ncbi:MAG: M20/M25/M40 family metallo-hydrolase [Chloroflexota bacterium]
MYELIKKLTEAWGPSGYEHQVRALIKEEVSDLADDMHVDGMGNLICRVGVKGQGKKVLIAAHMDEIGIMATYAEPNTNYLRFTNVGGLLYTSLHGNRVKFEDGTIGVIATHDAFGKGRTSAKSTDDFFIDVQDDSGEMTVREGSPAGFWRETQQRGKRVIAKSLDDRIGCVVAIETMRKLKESGTPNENYFAFTVQEEVGLRGARTAAFGVNPDIGIALDVTATGDEIHGRKMSVKLGGGAAIKVIDTSLIVPKAIVDWMVARAEADGIKHQLELLTGGGTDAGAIQTAHAGVPSGCISIPTRFLHTTSETVDMTDVQDCIDLLAGLLANDIALNND